MAASQLPSQSQPQPQQPEVPSWQTSPPPPPIVKTPTFHIRAYTLADAAQLARAANSPEIAHRMGDRFPVPYTPSSAVFFISRFGRPSPEAGMRDHNFGIFTRNLVTRQDIGEGGPLEQIVEGVKQNPGAAEASEEEEDEILIGGIGFMPQSGEARFTGDIGYWLTPSVWGKGLATRVVGEFVRWAFTTFAADTLVKLQARHHAGNERSGRVLEKNGFIREGILRKAWACRDDGDVVRAGEAVRSPEVDKEKAEPRHYLLDLYTYGLLREEFEAR